MYTRSVCTECGATYFVRSGDKGFELQNYKWLHFWGKQPSNKILYWDVSIVFVRKGA